MGIDPRKAAFAAVVAVLLGLGLFALLPGDDGDDTPAVAPTTTASTPSDDVVVVPGGAAAASSIPLPLTEEEITEAAALAADFTRRYTTYSYDQNDAKVLDDLTGFLGPDTDVDLSGVLPTGSLKKTLTAQRYSASSKTAVTKVLSLGNGFVSFVVTADLTTRTGGVTASSKETYFVALTEKASRWTVTDIDTSAATTATDNH